MAQKRLTNFALLPGGVENQLHSLNSILGIVSPEGIESAQLIQQFCSTWNVSANRANRGIRFLLQTDVLQRETAGRITKMGRAGQDWIASQPEDLSERDHSLLILSMHRRIRFVLEMLELLRKPQTKSSLLGHARAYFPGSVTVESKTYQRESWFRSAGFVKTDGRLLSLTQKGQDLLDAGGFELASPPESDRDAHAEPSTGPTDTESPTAGNDYSPETTSEVLEPGASHNQARAKALADEIRAAASDSGHPNRLEHALDAAFAFLGFATEWRSGSGQTDVLATARLAATQVSRTEALPWNSYVVAIDAKSSGDRLRQQPVDFDTLDEHRRHHQADYSLVIGPNPTGKRMFSRAEAKGVAVMSTEDMATVVEIHGRTPLTLIDYRQLVTQGGRVDIAPIRAASQRVERSWEIAKLVCKELAETGRSLRPMTASEVWVAIRRESGERFQPQVSEDEVTSVVTTLSSPFVGALMVTTGGGETPRYALAMPLTVVRSSLEQLSQRIAPD